jgi:ferritin-like metal-binding protein YciE
MKAWAVRLGMKDAVKLIDETLQQERKTDKDLTALAEAGVNSEALAA